MLRCASDPYGFKRTSKSSKKSSKIPKSFIKFSRKCLKDEYKRIRFGSRKYIYNENCEKLEKLTLSNEMIWKREQSRDPVECGRVLRLVYVALCTMIDIIYDGRPIQRFWFLEVVARMPYISYFTILHFYETLGWWTVDDGLREEHYKEDRNESQHLLVMESLGGSVLWRDRFFARHVAIAYYWCLVIFYMISPRTAYKSSELLEMHAVDTYLQFVEENEKLLETMPVPDITDERYNGSIWNLRQLFWLIASDERKHAEKMNELTRP